MTILNFTLYLFVQFYISLFLKEHTLTMLLSLDLQVGQFDFNFNLVNFTTLFYNKHIQFKDENKKN